MRKKGVMVGCDRHQEWMLAWWWSHYSKYNDLPVAFVDLGMTPEGRSWCQKRGLLIPLSMALDFIFMKKPVDAQVAEMWECAHGPDVWQKRSRWFLKPFAMLQSPFDLTVWTDLDCEVGGSLFSLFQKIHPVTGLALASCGSSEHRYNLGVVAFAKKAPFLATWARKCLEENHCFLSDQDVLNELITNEKIEFCEFSSDYNWLPEMGVNVEAIIVHWSGSWGKKAVANSLRALQAS